MREALSCTFLFSTTKTSSMFELIQSDLWTSPISSMSGLKYYILFSDDFTQFLWVFPLRNKSDVFDVFTNFYAYIRTQFQTNIKIFRCDMVVNSIITLFFLFRKKKIPYISQQNGKVETCHTYYKQNYLHFLFSSLSSAKILS